jgi:ribonuclease HI
MHEQRSKQSHKVGREEEGMSSNRPELVALRECLEAHPDNENLLYLTDSETTLQDINKWIGGGAKLSLAKTADADVLKAIIVKLQQRVEAKAATLLIKVKSHRGCPLNEEADIRTEIGRMKPDKEKTWSTPTKDSMDPGGPQQNATESRGDPSPTEPTRKERKSGERSTCREKGKAIFRQKGWSSWRTKSYGGMKRSFVGPFMTLGKGKDPM